MTYDYGGRKLSMDDPDMGDWSYAYDALGNLLSQTDARECTTSLGYDDLNRLTDKSFSGTCSATHPVNYVYDGGDNAIGFRTSMSDASGVTGWQYDVRGQVITETRVLTDSLGTFVTGWRYNAAGMLSEMIYPADDQGDSGEPLSFSLDITFGLPQVIEDNGHTC
jgi:YD repeat-containing protein